jgi:hypothetical protein
MHDALASGRDGERAASIRSGEPQPAVAGQDDAGDEAVLDDGDDRLRDVFGLAVPADQGALGERGEGLLPGFIGELVPPFGFDHSGRDGVDPAWCQLGRERATAASSAPLTAASPAVPGSAD